MTRMPPNASRKVDPRLDPIFVEREPNRFAARALAFLILLNGAAALVMLANVARAPASTVEPKFATAMLFFGGGAIAALLSSFLAYIGRTVAMEAPQRASLRQALLILAIAAVIGSGASFMTGINMVATAASERSSSHPTRAAEGAARPRSSRPKDQETPKSQATPEAKPSERVQQQTAAGAVSGIDRAALERCPDLGRPGKLPGEVVPESPEIGGQLVHLLADDGPVHHAAALQRIHSGIGDIGAADR